MCSHNPAFHPSRALPPPQAHADANAQNRFGWSALSMCVFASLLPGQPEPTAQHEARVYQLIEDLLQVLVLGGLGLGLGVLVCTCLCHCFWLQTRDFAYPATAVDCVDEHVYLGAHTRLGEGGCQSTQKQREHRAARRHSVTVRAVCCTVNSQFLLVRCQPPAAVCVGGQFTSREPARAPATARGAAVD